MNTKWKSADEVMKKDGPFTFAHFMVTARDHSGLTQVQMAKKLKIAPGTLCDIEKGRQLVSLGLAAKIAKLAGHSPDFAVLTAIQDQLRKAKLKYKVKLVA